MCKNINQKYFLMQHSLMKAFNGSKTILHKKKSTSGLNFSTANKIQKTVSFRSKVESKFDFTKKLNYEAKNSIIKREKFKSILVAVPDRVEFRNFERKKKYEKTIELRNIVCRAVRYQIKLPSIKSNFHIRLNKGKSYLAAGLQTKITISFHSLTLENQNDFFIIYVENGMSVVIELHAFRNSPILRICDTLSQCRNVPIFNLPYGPLSLISTKQPPIRQENYFQTEYSHQRIILTAISCKKCFLGEQISCYITIKNLGEEGRFFLFSELDWYYMEIKDVSNSNRLILPNFTIWPVYFFLKNKHEMILHVDFHPISYGVHIHKLFIVCDNCSVQTIEIVGDGIFYELEFFKFSENMQRILPSSVNPDASVYYQLNLGQILPNNTFRKQITIENTSEITVYFHWIKEEYTAFHGMKNIPFSKISIFPEQGILPALSKLDFLVTVTSFQLLYERHFIFLKFIVEDIPLQAITKDERRSIFQPLTKRRICGTSIDVCEAIVQVVIEDAELNIEDEYQNFEKYSIIYDTI